MTTKNIEAIALPQAINMIAKCIDFKTFYILTSPLLNYLKMLFLKLLTRKYAVTGRLSNKILLKYFSRN